MIERICGAPRPGHEGYEHCGRPEGHLTTECGDWLRSADAFDDDTPTSKRYLTIVNAHAERTGEEAVYGYKPTPRPSRSATFWCAMQADRRIACAEPLSDLAARVPRALVDDMSAHAFDDGPDPPEQYIDDLYQRSPGTPWFSYTERR